MPETPAAPVVTPAPQVDAKGTPAVDPAATETIKVNGKDIKVTPAQLRVLAQKGHFADQTLKSVDVLKRSTEGLLGKLKTPEGIISLLQDKSIGANPKEVIRKLIQSDLIDDELAGDLEKWVYEKRVKPSKMTPEELEREKKLTEYERLKADADKRKQTEEQQQQQGKIQQVYQAVRGEVTKQIVADKTFPQTEGAISAVINTLRAMNKGGAPITAENVTKAIGKVKKDHLLNQQAMFDAIEDPEALIAFFGEARALKISKALVARLQNKQKAALKEEKKGEKVEGLQEGINRKYGKTPSGHTIMPW